MKKGKRERERERENMGSVDCGAKGIQLAYCYNGLTEKVIRRSYFAPLQNDHRKDSNKEMLNTNLSLAVEKILSLWFLFVFHIFGVSLFSFAASLKCRLGNKN